VEPADPPWTPGAPAGEPSPVYPPPPPAPIGPPAPLPLPADGAPPWALIAGLALSAVAGIIVGVGYHVVFTNRDSYDELGPQIARWSLLDIGFDAAVASLILVGGIELVRRSAGTARTGAKIIVGAAIALLVLKCVQQAINTFYIPLHDDMSIDTRRSIWEWTSRCYATTWLAIASGIAVTCWHRAPLRPFAIGLVVAMLLAVPYDFYAKYLYELLDSDGGRSIVPTIVFGALGLTTAALSAVLLCRLRAPAETEPGWDRAARGLDRTASALYARLWIALSGALLVVMLFSSRGSGGESMAKLWLVGIPLANAIAGLVLVTGVFGAAGLAVAGAPRKALVASGAAMAFTLMVSSLQVALLVFVVVKENRDLDNAEDTVQALPVLLPIVGGIALVLLGIGLSRLARLVGSPELQRRATGAITAVVISQLVVSIAPWVMQKSPPTSPGSMIFALLVIAGAAIVALLVLARTCRELATALRMRYELPVAQVFR
jgi:hypothetical protein